MENGNAGNQGREWGVNAPDFAPPAEIPRSPEQGGVGKEILGMEQASGEAIQATPEMVGPESVISALPPMPETAIMDTGEITEGAPLTAKDGERIEKEWVAKTQDTVNEYKSDPKNLNIEINKLKSEYMKKRFGRVLGDRN